MVAANLSPKIRDETDFAFHDHKSILEGIEAIMREVKYESKEEVHASMMSLKRKLVEYVRN
jgi:hypothetical protein